MDSPSPAALKSPLDAFLQQTVHPNRGYLFKWNTSMRAVGRHIQEEKNGSYKRLHYLMASPFIRCYESFPGLNVMPYFVLNVQSTWKGYTDHRAEAQVWKRQPGNREAVLIPVSPHNRRVASRAKREQQLLQGLVLIHSTSCSSTGLPATWEQQLCLETFSRNSSSRVQELLWQLQTCWYMIKRILNMGPIF